MGNKKNKNNNSTPSNNDKAELSAGVAPAAPAPAPLISIALSDADALENVKRRVADNKNRKGRSALRIPLSSAQNVAGGISIPL